MIYIKIKSLNNFVKNGWTKRNDLFITIQYKTQKRQTTIKWNDANPIWNEAFIFEEQGTDVITFKLYDSNIFDKDIILMEESVPIFLGKIQEFNIGKFKFDMGNPLIDLETEQKINNLTDKIIALKNEKNILNEKINNIKSICQD